MHQSSGHPVGGDLEDDEQLGAVKEIIEASKVKQLRAWDVALARRLPRQQFMGLTSEQSLYNLARDGRPELELSPRGGLGIGLVPYSPLGKPACSPACLTTQPREAPWMSRRSTASRRTTTCSKPSRASAGVGAGCLWMALPARPEALDRLRPRLSERAGRGVRSDIGAADVECRPTSRGDRDRRGPGNQVQGGRYNEAGGRHLTSL